MHPVCPAWHLRGKWTLRGDLMKRIGIWAFYAVGAIAIAYLALYAYAVFRGNDLQPGDPIRIFRKPGAPSYSTISTSLRA